MTSDLLWYGIFKASVALAADSAAVISLRLEKFGREGAASGDEIGIMLQEKLVAGLGLYPLVMKQTGCTSPFALQREIIDHFHRPVVANHKRLSALRESRR